MPPPSPIPPMLRATIWHDLQWRFLAALLLVTPPAILVAWSYRLQPQRSTTGPAGLSYPEYLDAAWFWLPGASAVFLPAAVLLGASGVVLRPSPESAYLLALPISRGHWLRSHLLSMSAALAVLVLVAHTILALGAWRSGVPLAAGPVLARSLAVLVAAGAWIGVTVGLLALVRRPLVAATLVLVLVAMLPPTRFRLDLPVRPAPQTLPSWDPWAVADPRAWQSSPPFASLLAALALGAAGILFAWYRLERLDP